MAALCYHYATKFWDSTVMDDITSVKTRSVLEEITTLARQHGVTYTSMPLDKLGDAMARSRAMTWSWTIPSAFCSP
jgi:hypothetical protein